MTRDEARTVLADLLQHTTDPPQREALALAVDVLAVSTWQEDLIKRYPNGIPADVHLPGSDF